MNPLISVVMSVFNGEKTVGDAMASILQQSFRDFEFIIINDASTDNSRKILESFSDPRILLIHNEINMGQARSLNRGIVMAKGRYIARLDADDIAHPTRLELQVNIMESHPAYGVLGSRSVIFFGNNSPLWPKEIPTSPPPRDITGKIFKFNPLNHSSILMRRSVFYRAGRYDEARKGQIDYDLWIRIAATQYRLGIINVKLVGQRLHKDQFFEKRNRLFYLLGSAQTQLRAIYSLNAPLHNYFFVPFKFIYGLLPQKLRGYLHNVKEIIHEEFV